MIVICERPCCIIDRMAFHATLITPANAQGQYIAELEPGYPQGTSVTR